MDRTEAATLNERVEAVRDALGIFAAYSNHMHRDPRHDEVEIVLRGPKRKLSRLVFEVLS